VSYKIKDKAGNYIYNREAVKASIDISLDVEKNIGHLLGYPHTLEYEKTFWPFILISKKRYAGDKYEFDAHKYKQISMGLVTKRRDNAKIVKYVYGGILDIIMGDKDLEKSIEFLQRCVRDVMKERFEFDKFVITKKLKAFYKRPDSIAHKVLADRMGERDPGNKPKPNSRLPYAFIEVKGNKKKMLQGNRIEHPQYIRDHDLKLDYAHYITNQVSKPVSQIYGLELENLDEKYNFPYDKDYYKRKYMELVLKYKHKKFPEEEAEKKVREYRTKMAQKLLIDPILSQLQRQQAVTDATNAADDDTNTVE
jgi:DNA polymerase elongation subunit (family B)